MKHWIMFFVLGLLAISLVGSGLAQQVPGQGFSNLVCQAGVNGSGTFELGNGQIMVVIDDGPTTPGGTGTATVTIQHGKSGSTHTLTYEDTNSDGQLDCGDTVLSIS
jgi:hypothetical protein